MTSFHSSTRPIDLLLQRMDGIKKSGSGWRAQCPACGGSRDKVSFCESASGSVLLHCFGGCTGVDVLKALGLESCAVFPTRASPDTPAQRAANRRALASAGLSAAVSVLGKEATMVSIAAGMGARGEFLSEDDLARLALALERIEDARAVFRGR